MTEQERQAKKKNIILLFATLMVTMLLASLSQMVFSSALPTIVGELNGVEHMAWVITAYMLASTIMMPVYGKLSDLFGRKPMLLSAIGLFLAGSVIGVFAADMTWLIVSRVVQGLGGGGLIILSQAAVADVIPARDRGKYMGIMGGVFALSSIAGPLLGGWLTEGPGWRWAFILNVPLALLAVVAVLFLMRLPKRARAAKPKIDYLGMTLLAAITTTLLLAVTWGGSVYAWASVQIIGLLVATVVFAGVFVAVERRAAEPVMPLALFKERNFILSTLAAMCVAVAMFGAIGYMPTYFQMAVGASASVAGLLMTPMMVSMLLTSVIAGAIVSKTGKYKLFPIVGSVILGIGLAALSLAGVDAPVALICASMAIIGVGLGMNMQILTLIVQNSFPHKMVGTATAGNNYFRQVGSSLGAAVVGALFTTRLGELLAERFPDGMGAGVSGGSLTPDMLLHLPDAVRLPIVESYNTALIPIFMYLIPLAAVAVVATLYIKEKPLAEAIEHEIPAEALSEGQVLTTEYDGKARVR